METAFTSREFQSPPPVITNKNPLTTTQHKSAENMNTFRYLWILRNRFPELQCFSLYIIPNTSWMNMVKIQVRVTFTDYEAEPTANAQKNWVDTSLAPKQHNNIEVLRF